MADVPGMLSVPACAGALALLLAGCLGGGAAESETATGSRGTLHVAASFYPLQWVTEQVAGAAADVVSLTPPGAEPHDLELGPRQVAAVGEADLVVYLAGFQPAVDKAVGTTAAGATLDAADVVDLQPVADHSEDEGDAHGHGDEDPHFWLDPLRLADVGDALAVRLGRLAPADAAAFERNAATLRSELTALDEEFSTALADCDSTDLVTSHNAFGYLAERYGLTQRGITGLTPDEEPSPGALADVADFVAAHHVRTIYYETLTTPAVAETLARETGAQTAVLDPLEGLDDASAGTDYLEVMRLNLASLSDGQSCR